MILVLILIFLCLVLVLLSAKCVELVVKPYRYTEEEMRKEEIEHGFLSSIEAYEKVWEREPFELISNGVTLSGEIIKNPKGKDKVAIVCHGHTVNRYASIKYADMFYQRGFHVVIYDERHFGRSTGEICTLGQEEAKDLVNVYQFVKERFPKDCKVIIHGESMGAATALLSLKQIKPELVIADCPFCDSERLFGEFVVRNLKISPLFIVPIMKRLAKWKYGYCFEEVSPIKAVEETDVPICFIHGKDDKLIVCDHSEQMYKTARNPLSRLYLFEGADHAQSVRVDRERYEKIIDEFLKECEMM